MMIFALTSHDIDEAIFHVASALQVPVLILALLALAAVIFELGSYARRAAGAQPAASSPRSPEGAEKARRGADQRRPRCRRRGQ